MGRVFRFELARALGGARFRLAAAAGAGVALLHFLTGVLPLTRWLDSWREKPFLAPHSACTHWIGMDLGTIWPVLLFLLLPLLAALPAADSAWWDRDSGYLNQIRLRCPARQYRAAKAGAVFVSAFCVTVLPLMLDFLLTSAMLPCVRPEPAGGACPLSDRNLFGAWFYRHPLLYILGSIVFDGVLLAAWTTLPLALGRWMRHGLHALLAPFLLYLAAWFLDIWSGSAFVSPMALLLPFQPVADIPPWLPLAVPAGLAALLAGLYLRPGRRAEDAL